MRSIIIGELNEAMGWMGEDDGLFSYHVGKAGGVAAAIGETGTLSEWFCDAISNSYELFNFAEGGGEESADTNPEGVENASKNIANLEGDFARLIEVLEKAQEDDPSGEDNAAPRLSWEEYGVALNEAKVAREAGDGLRYSLMIGFVCGMMFWDPGPCYEEGSILQAIEEGYEKDDLDKLEWAGARLVAGHRHSDPSPFMKKAAYDRYMERKLGTMRWVQNFGLQAARKGDDGVAVLNSMMINHALRQSRSGEA